MKIFNKIVLVFLFFFSFSAAQADWRKGLSAEEVRMFEQASKHLKIKKPKKEVRKVVKKKAEKKTPQKIVVRKNFKKQVIASKVFSFNFNLKNYDELRRLAKSRFCDTKKGYVQCWVNLNKEINARRKKAVKTPKNWSVPVEVIAKIEKIYKKKLKKAVTKKVVVAKKIQKSSPKQPLRVAKISKKPKIFFVQKKQKRKHDEHIAELIKKHFPKLSRKERVVFSAVVAGESNYGRSDSWKGVDVTKDGFGFSKGVCQVNLTVHKVGGLNCPAAFDGKNRNATVVNKPLYRKCVQKAENPSINLMACNRIYYAAKKNPRTGYNPLQPWGAYTNGSYKRHIKYAGELEKSVWRKNLEIASR